MTCAVCARGETAVHAECLLTETLAALAELIAVAVAPVIVVWAG